jgi:hypothetical protein
MKINLKNKKTVSINFEMSELCNAKLTVSARNTARSKKREASVRLDDHLKRFPNQVWEEKQQ